MYAGAYPRLIKTLGSGAGDCFLTSFSHVSDTYQEFRTTSLVGRLITIRNTCSLMSILFILIVPSHSWYFKNGADWTHLDLIQHKEQTRRHVIYSSVPFLTFLYEHGQSPKLSFSVSLSDKQRLQLFATHSMKMELDNVWNKCIARQRHLMPTLLLGVVIDSPDSSSLWARSATSFL